MKLTVIGINRLYRIMKLFKIKNYNYIKYFCRFINWTSNSNYALYNGTLIAISGAVSCIYFL